MTGRARVALLLLFVATACRAETVAIDSLRALALEYQTIRPVDLYPGQPVSAQVAAPGGEAFAVVAPARVQQISYVVPAGTVVAQGEAFALLRGPEIHHFLTEYEATAQLLEDASRRYENHRELYEKKAIDESRWVEVSERYQTLRLEYEHMRHFHDLVIEERKQDDAILLGAPIAGITDYAYSAGGLRSGDTIASFIPRDAIRLVASIPHRQSADLAFLEAAGCRLAVSRVSGITTGFFVEAWSEPVTDKCALIPGQRLAATPLYRTSAFRLPRTAVLQREAGSHVFLREGDVLRAVPVELLAADEADYIVTSTTPLGGREALVTSVSAVQGVLLGLGDE
ncbi:MAG: hypothetical protein P8Y92_07285 [Halioglobus sp.]